MNNSTSGQVNCFHFTADIFMDTAQFGNKYYTVTNNLTF